MGILTESVQTEYWYHVSNQNEIPIAGEVERSLDTGLLMRFLAELPDEQSELGNYLYRELSSNQDLVDILRTLVGVSDKRMYLELSYIFSKTLRKDSEESLSGDSPYDLNKHSLSFFKNLIGSSDIEIAERSTELICEYFIDREISSVLRTLARLSSDEVEDIVDKLIITKEIQQKEAKRRGHGAEFELAKFLHNLECKFIPPDRHLKPMGSRDPNVSRETFELCKKEKGKTWSFDLIVVDSSSNPKIFIQALIHTSDPGQYGVNKSDETVLVKRSLEAHNKRYGGNKKLWGLVDGVGFCENKEDTINKMLREFDNFVQLKSIYKAGLGLHRMGLARVKGIRFDDEFYPLNDREEMYKEYGSPDIQLVDNRDDGLKLGREIESGKAWLYV